MKKIIFTITTALTVTALLSACAAPAVYSEYTPTSEVISETALAEEPSVPLVEESIPKPEPEPEPESEVQSDMSETSENYTEILEKILSEQQTKNQTTEPAPANMVSITPDSIIDVTGEGVWPNTAFNFTKTMMTGSTIITKDATISFPYEGRWGIDAYAEGMTVYLKAYSNIGINPLIRSIELTGHNESIDLTGDIDYKNYHALDFTGVTGVRKLSVTFEVNKVNITSDLIIYVDNDEAWLCELHSLSVDDLTERQNKFNKFMSDLNFTPENQLDIDIITYPRAPVDGARCDTQRWADLSEEIITNPDWSDGRKVMMLHDWICINIAYDRYRVNVLHKCRDIYYNDYSGTYSVWNTRTGVCGDVSNIFVIMCRHNGIPCVTCEDGVNHQWVAVYINGKWYEMDLTKDMYRYVTGADVNDITISGKMSYISNYSSSKLYSINNNLWTYDIDMGLSYGNYDWYYN